MAVMLASTRPSEIGGISLLAFVLLTFYGLVVLARKLRFQQVSSKLGATYIQNGWIVPGKVVGDDFVIEARPLRAGTSNTYRTRVQVAAASTPGPYLLKRNFFRNFPDWNFAKVLGIQSERLFATTVAIPRYAESTTGQQSMLLEWLRRARSFDADQVYQAMKKFRIREVRIDMEGLTVTFPGAVSNFGRLQGTLDVLRSLRR